MKRFSTIENNSVSLVLFFLLVVAASNFMLLGIYFFLFTACAFLLTRRRIGCSLQILPLFLFAVSYAFFVSITGSFGVSALKIFVCPLVWLFGYNISFRQTSNKIITYMCALAIGAAIHGIANFFYNISVGVDMSLGRTYDFFSGSLSAATGQATYFTMLVAISFWMIFLQRNLWARLLGALLYITALLYDVQLGGRTFLVLSVLALPIGLLLYCFFVARGSQADRKKVFRTLLLVICIVSLAIIAFNSNFLGIKDIYEDSYLYKRLEIYNATDLDSDSRFFRKAQYFKLVPEYLFGGNHISVDEDLGYAHELWLDIYDDAGMITYILIVLYTGASLIRFIKAAKMKKTELLHKVCLLSFCSIMMLQFFVEPILQGAPMLLYSYIVVDGMLASYLRTSDTIGEVQ